MTRQRSAVIILVLAAAFTWIIVRLLDMQSSAGGFYPEYSSLRADPRGTKLLFDSLTRLLGLRTDRNYLPLEYFEGKHATLLLLGLHLQELTPEFLAQFEKLAHQGDRVVLALAFQEASRTADRSPVEGAWKIRLAIDEDPKSRHPLSIADPGPAVVREWAESKIVAIERKVGEGSVLLFTESMEFSNETLVNGRLEPVVTALGPNTHVVFDEQHFGIAESGSVVGLARRFRLAGLAFGLMIVAALALWKNTSPFPPPQPTRAGDHHTGRTSFEGLVTLLQRHVRPQTLAAACWDEWLKANRQQVPADRFRQAAEIAAAGGRDPLLAIREIQAGLRAKGEL